mgnify:CR=1 FL=1
MKNLKLNRVFVALLLSTITITFTSCDNDDDNTKIAPIQAGSSVTVTNTFQSTAFTQDAELAIEELFQVPAGSLAATATVDDQVEFPAYLLNLYDIDISRNSIDFEVVAEADDQTYGDLFRVLEPNTFDRYYFTFTEAQNVNSFTSSNSSVTLRLDSDNVLVVEIGEGYDFNPDQSFSITLN